MKESYTYLCPDCHGPFSYAPDPGETVRCILTRYVGNGEEKRAVPCRSERVERVAR